MYPNYKYEASKRLEDEINNLDPISAEIVYQAALDFKESLVNRDFKDLMFSKSKLFEVLKTCVPGDWEIDPFPSGLKYNGTFFYCLDICPIILGDDW